MDLTNAAVERTNVKDEQAQTARQHEKRKRMIFTIFIEILLVGVAIVWVLNILEIIGGPWGAILAAIFTMLGVGIALLQSQVPPQE